MPAGARLVIGLALAVPLGIAAEAEAACPNVCSLTVEPPSLDQALTCVTARVTPNNCDCGAELVVVNNCADLVAAQDFLFDTCSLPGQPYQQFGHACAPVDSTGTGSVNLKIASTDGTGARTWSLHLSEAGVSYPVTVQATVSSFGAGGCVCALTPGPCQMAGGLPFAALLVLAFGRRRRR